MDVIKKGWDLLKGANTAVGQWVGKDWGNDKPAMRDLPPDIGYPVDRTDVPPEYLIKICSSWSDQKVCVRAVMQDNIEIGVVADWVPYSAGLSQLGDFIQRAAQAGTGRALVSRFMSRRIWMGTSPIVLSLKFLFVAYDDPMSEVVLPCRVLQQMVLPSSSFEWKGIMGGFVENISLVPPGPSPFYSGVVNEKISEVAGVALPTSRIGHIINIYLGRLFNFSKVIVKKVDVKIPPRFNAFGYPVAAEVDMQFETFEITTKEDLEEIYVPVQAKLSTGLNAGTNEVPGITTPNAQGNMVA